MFEAAAKPDWVELKTARLLAAAKRSGFFRDCIRDAEAFAADGYVWDVALAMSCEFWCR
jgi:hypothetical protein